MSNQLTPEGEKGNQSPPGNVHLDLQPRAHAVLSSWKVNLECWVERVHTEESRSEQMTATEHSLIRRLPAGMERNSTRLETAALVLRL